MEDKEELDFKVEMNLELLIWARLNEGMTLEDASEKLEIESKELRKLELGVKKPMWSFIKKCAEVYKRQTAFFLLNKPPKQDRKVLIGVKLVYSDTTEEYFYVGEGLLLKNKLNYEI